MGIAIEKRIMLEAVKQSEGARTFLKDMFFPIVKLSNGSKVEIDIVKGNRKVAPFVHQVVGGKVVPNSGYETRLYTPPLVAPDKVLTGSDLYNRSAGENPYETRSQEERAAEKTAESLIELEEMISRREEVMCAQALFTGSVYVKGDDIDETITFGMNPLNSFTLAKLWSDPTVDKLATIESAYKIGQKNGFTNSDVCLMADDLVNLLLADEKVLKILDCKNVELAKFAPKMLPDGAVWVGKYSKLNLDIYSYNAMYLDDWTDAANPTEKTFVPSGKFLLAPSKKFVMGYGALEAADDDTDEIYLVEAKRLPDQEVKKKPVRKVISLSSRPLPIPTNVDSIVVVTAL